MMGRRQFLIFTGYGILSLFISNRVLEKLLNDFQNVSKNATPKWGMIIDLKKFNAFSIEKKEEVINVCRLEHNIPLIGGKDRVEWIWLMKFGDVFSRKNFLESYDVPVLCNHCENPPCVKVCPTQATFKREDGIVQQDYHRCIGCRYCMAACPYGARSFNWRDPKPFIPVINPNFPVRTKGVVEKCNFCAERIETGELPACVEKSDGSFIFGDLNNINSKINKILDSNYYIQRKEYLSTEPKVYYLI
jgi:molybdopterin-containing oxidoreductase family iron-sulfur binding subunit